MANQHVFAFKTSDLGNTGLVKHVIDTQRLGPIRQRLDEASLHQKGVSKKIIEELLADNIIHPSLSPWAAAIVLVKKKTGGYQLCIDYRKLNAATKKDSFPLPRIVDVLDLLHGQPCFSTLDLVSDNWQIEMEESSKEKPPSSWKNLAFGLTNAPGTFQRFMNFILQKEIGKTCLVYLDDIIVFSKINEDHMKNQNKIFELLDKANLRVKLLKCKFLTKSVHYLGHIISAEVVAPDPNKVDALANYSKPRTVKELQSFLGFTSYYRRFIKRFSTIAHTLL